MAKRRRKPRGYYSIMMLAAALFAIVTVCGFMIMVWYALLLDTKDAEAGNCHFAAVTTIVNTAVPNESEKPLFQYLERIAH